jgi:hypothetical protein
MMTFLLLVKEAGCTTITTIKTLLCNRATCGSLQVHLRRIIRIESLWNRWPCSLTWAMDGDIPRCENIIWTSLSWYPKGGGGTEDGRCWYVVSREGDSMVFPCVDKRLLILSLAGTTKREMNDDNIWHVQNIRSTPIENDMLRKNACMRG